MSELGGDQWEARMSGPANLNVPRRKKTGSWKKVWGSSFPSPWTRIYCGGTREPPATPAAGTDVR